MMERPFGMAQGRQITLWDEVQRVVPLPIEAQDDANDILVRVRARKTDPEPSHVAARDLVASGELGRQQAVTFELVRRRPGLTSHELAEGNVTLRYCLARRLPELARPPLMLVKRGPARPCRVTGRLATTWSLQ
jgi:hypothetical protein